MVTRKRNPEFAEFLVRVGIDSISLKPDSVVDAIHYVARVESRRQEHPR